MYTKVRLYRNLQWYFSVLIIKDDVMHLMKQFMNINISISDYVFTMFTCVNISIFSMLVNHCLCEKTTTTTLV